MSAPALKLLQGGERPRCPACRRQVTRKHKRYAGGPWCDGKPDVVHDRAMDMIAAVYSSALDLIFEGHSAEALTLIKPSYDRLTPAQKQWKHNRR